MNELERYLKLIVELTVDEFARNPNSVRHAFLACVAAYHAIDRVTYPKSPGNLRKRWGKESVEFCMVDVVVHHFFKHVKSDDGRTIPRAIPMSFALLGSMALNTHRLNDTGQVATLRNLVFVVRSVVRFLHEKAKTEIKRSAPSPPRARRQPTPK